MFSEQTLSFLSDLKANNTREWFEANKARYRRDVKAPANSFAEALADLLEAETGMPHQAKIFRINRDLRFSKDKTPYNAHVHMSFTPSGAGPDAPTWMVGLEPGRLVTGVGVFAFSKSGLDHWRASVDGPEGEALEALLRSLQKKKHRLDEPELKRVPAPFDADHPRATLLRRKGLAVWTDAADVKAALGAPGHEKCARALLGLKPVYSWLLAFAEGA